MQRDPKLHRFGAGAFLSAPNRALIRGRGLALSFIGPRRRRDSRSFATRKETRGLIKSSTRTPFEIAEPRAVSTLSKNLRRPRIALPAYPVGRAAGVLVRRRCFPGDEVGTVILLTITTSREFAPSPIWCGFALSRVSQAALLIPSGRQPHHQA